MMSVIISVVFIQLNLFQSRNHELHEQIKSEQQRIEAERKLQQEEDEENMRRFIK